MNADVRYTVLCRDPPDRQHTQERSSAGPILERLHDGSVLADRVGHADLLQGAHCVHPQGETGTDFVELRRALVHRRFDPSPAERKRSRETANPGSHDDRSHC
jgi:hypothetical protein